MKQQYTEEDYKKNCAEKDLIYIKYSKRPKQGTMIHFICPRHQNKGEQVKDWSHFKNYTYGCSYCSGRGQTTEEIQEKVKNPDVKIISQYLGNEKPITCECLKCHYQWTTLPKVLITNGSGCPQCGIAKRNDAERKSLDDFIAELHLVNPNIKVLGEYVNTHTPIKCQCLRDGHIWFPYPANLLNKSAGCPKCNMSLHESTMLSVLDDLNIQYISQYSIPECRYKQPLKFDAYNTEYDVAFEYNGEQHYRAIDFAGKGKEWAQEQLKINQKRDKIKSNYCKDHNISLIVIPYWEKGDMKNYIVTQLRKENIPLIA